MAKSKGGVRAAAESRRVGGLRDWIVTDLSGDSEKALFLAPDGKMYDVMKIAGPNAIHAEAAPKLWQALGKGEFDEELGPEMEMPAAGWGTFRYWNMGGKRALSMTIPEQGSAALRRAQRALARIADMGLEIYKPNLTVQTGFQEEDGTWEGYWNGSTADFLSAKSWRDLG
jgi:hypothetical protein